MLKDIETGQSRRMGYVTFEDGRSLTEAIEEMHETVVNFAFACPAHTSACISSSNNVGETDGNRMAWLTIYAPAIEGVCTVFRNSAQVEGRASLKSAQDSL